MNRLRTFLTPSVFLLFLLTMCGAASPPYREVLRVRDGRTITFQQMVAELGRADLIFAGENHDNARHHRAQLDVIESLSREGIPLAIGLEMFRSESQQDLSAWTSGKIRPDRFVNIYYRNWDLPWTLYRRIFIYAREQAIPMIGLNIPEEISSKVAKSGFQSLSQAELKKLPPGISCNVDQEYMKFIKNVYEGHHAEGKSFMNFCEAQMVWDKTMAWNLIAYKKQFPERKVVVLAGTGHSWKRGIPAQVARDSGYRSVTILPEVPGKVHRRSVSPQDADYLLID